MKPPGPSGKAQVIPLGPRVRLNPRGIPELLQLWKTSGKTFWLLQIPARKESHSVKWAELGCKDGKKKRETPASLTSLTSLTISNQPQLFGSWLTTYQTGLRIGTASLCHQCIYRLNLLYYFLVTCPKSTFCPALCLYLCQLLLSQHLISIYFQFPMRLFKVYKEHKFTIFSKYIKDLTTSQHTKTGLV